ncbi:MAG: hypothetical protein J5988_01995 [Eubacterium sp.]|nr:hypothetical protein [Eubacterium sp.]
MQVRLSSQEREIISHGTVFLFHENADFTINIAGDDSFEMSINIHFVEDVFQERGIDANLSQNHIEIICTNFAAAGTGLTVPMEIAVVDGRKIYLMFWVYLEGSEDKKSKARKVEYTLYCE